MRPSIQAPMLSKPCSAMPVVDARLSAFLAVHLPPEARVEEPFHQLGAAHAERILQILVRPGAVAVDGDGETLDAEF